MAKEQTIGNIGPDTLVGSIFTMEGGERYVLGQHQADDKEGFALMGMGGASELDGFHGYAEWNEDYAPFVTEIKYPEAAVDETPAEAPEPEDIPDRPNPHEDPAAFGNGPVSVDGQLLLAEDEAMDNFRDADAEYESLADQAKAAKKRRDECQEDVNRAVERRMAGRVTKAGWPLDAPLAAVADEAPVAEGDSDWKAVELADLTDPHIKVGILKVLAENGIYTMGQLAEWQAEKGDFWAKDLKGVGKAACDSISDATDAYWTRNPRPVEDEPLAAPAAESSSAACNGSCGWHELSDEIQDMLDDDRYEFANDTLIGISDWINENEHCTEAQKQAVKNVRESAENR